VADTISRCRHLNKNLNIWTEAGESHQRRFGGPGRGAQRET
jgi:hypothetical protein